MINRALILSAGFGTRMGNIGKKLPKVLWPIFEQSLLETQIDWVRSLGISDIYVNTHHCAERIEEAIASKRVKILREAQLLGSGGAVFNLAAQADIQYRGNVLLVNCDLFFMLEQVDLKKMLDLLKFYNCVLASVLVDPKGYNGIIVDNDKMIGIDKEAKQIFKGQLETYSGISLVNLEKLPQKTGVQNFFPEVANYPEGKVGVLRCWDREYWDFGTTRRYHQKMFELLDENKKKIPSKLLKFLIENKIFKKEYYRESYRSYHSDEQNTINCSKQFRAKSPERDFIGIIYHDLKDPIEN